jgi:phosphoribosyl-ATP pyrophosphohydrolase/phosphoribosyl-AMP cyclohydrolase
MTPDFTKSAEGLVPVIIQDNTTSKVLMLGYMNSDAFEKTNKEQRVTFYSRSKKRLWTKGEESGHFLDVVNIALDCDSDALLIHVNPHGAVCHTGSDTCFNERNESANFLTHLETLIQNRKKHPDPNSYTSRLFASGINKVAQKVGEEAVEVVIEAKDNDPLLFKNEAADLLYHYLVLLVAKDIKLADVLDVLKERNTSKSGGAKG